MADSFHSSSDSLTAAVPPALRAHLLDDQHHRAQRDQREAPTPPEAR